MKLRNKIPNVSGLAAAVVLIKKIEEVENKTPDVSKLVSKTDYDAKISQIMGKYLNTADCNKFSKSIFDAKIKEKELADKSNISNLVKNPDSNIKLESLATKAELNGEHDKKSENAGI